MSWLLFMDESGHDHKNMPYEVRGGVALEAKELWPFVQDIQRLEVEAFGTSLFRYSKEIKGSRLLCREHCGFAIRDEWMTDDARRKHAKSLLDKGSRKERPVRAELSAYGQACIVMARGIFQVLRDHKAVLFASAVPKSVPRPRAEASDEFLRKDHVFLFERYFYFLEARRQHGLIVMDEVEKEADKRFVRRMEAYFTRTNNGRIRTAWIVPVPLFVSSEMAAAVQAADVCIYCVNWGFRLPSQGMDSPTRQEIADEFGPWLNQLQFRGEGHRDGLVFQSYGILFEPDPYNTKPAHKKGR